ncbi:hypothetical protein NOH83_004648 [Salmonella enterica]|nr:hypothetical protein [Salmonella enterica]
MTDEAGKTLFTGVRSWSLITFRAGSDGTVSFVRGRSYDLYASTANGRAMSADIAALTEGTVACVMTYDEPSTNRDSIMNALLTLGATRSTVNAIVFRGAYLLLGRKGMTPGEGREFITASGSVQAEVRFTDGVMQVVD